MADLFAGTGSASEPMVRRGWEVERIELLQGGDVRTWAPTGHYDLIWASPPCECFSVASMGTHWVGGPLVYRPADDETRAAVDLVRTTLAKIALAAPTYWAVENPTGHLRNVIGRPTIGTTWWCQWEDERAKPTDLWGRIPRSMLPLPTCRNGEGDHAAAPRGSKSGTQGRAGADRGRIPRAFAEALAVAVERAVVDGEITLDSWA